MHRAVRENHHSVFSVVFVFQEHDEGPRNHRDPRFGLHVLERRPEHIPRGIPRSGHFAVRIARFNHHHGEVQRIEDEPFGLFAGQPFGRPQLEHEFDIGLFFRMFRRVDDPDISVQDVFQSPVRGQAFEFGRIPDQRNVRDPCSATSLAARMVRSSLPSGNTIR